MEAQPGFWSDTRSVWHRSLLRKRIITALLAIAVWSVAWVFYLSIRFIGHSETAYPLDNDLEIDFVLALNIGIRSGVIFGIFFAFVEIFFEYPFFRRMQYGALIALKTLIYLVLFIIGYTITTVRSYVVLGQEVEWERWWNSTTNTEMLTLVIYFFLVCVGINAFKQLDVMLGPGNILKILTGKFYHPKEEERIFVFIDLKDSTTHAERLGPLKFGELIQDCYNDLVVVEQNKAEVYQYVGDEVILIWTVEEGIHHGNCLWAYYKFFHQLGLRSKYYQDKYGIEPFFKAGATVGKVIAMEVGELKREITYLGDPLNTAARVQGLCNELGRKFLITKELKKLIDTTPGLEFHDMGEVVLRGRSAREYVYAVEVSPSHD